MMIRQGCAVVVLMATLVGATASRVMHAAPAGTPAGQVPAATPELLLDQARRFFDAFQYDEAVPLLDRLVSNLATGGVVQRPELLEQAYQFRGRARFALGDQAGAEQDFSALLALNPSQQLSAGVSPRVLEVFEAVRKLTVGQLVVTLAPAGNITIRGRAIAAGTEPLTVDLGVGEHEVVARRTGYTDFAQRVTIAAGQPTNLAIVLERVSATLTLSTVPAEVEVLLNGMTAGTTARGAGDTSTPFVLDGLPNGSHRVVFRRSCFQDVERTITIARPEDVTLEPVRLTPSVATVRITASDPSATILVDGARRGTGSLELTNLCEGLHVIEARGPRGRFIDRRQWKTGDAVTLNAALRSAFPVVSSAGVPPAALERVHQSVERALDGNRRVLLFFPSASDLAPAVEAEMPPPDWLSAETGEGASRITRDVRRELGRRIAERLEVQGVAALRTTGDINRVTLTLLASGSGEPESIALDLNDPASRTRAMDLLSRPLPKLVRGVLDAGVVDLPGVQGATVVRVGAAAAKAGLAVGDVITNAGGTPVTNVADLRARLDGVDATGQDVPLSVRTGANPERTISGAVFLSTEILPTQDARILYNRALLDLREAAAAASSPIDTESARLNLAIVEMRLGNWSDALQTLAGTKLPDRAGVSAGTVAYLTALCHEALGQRVDAEAAFARAAAAPEARLSVDGPRVAPLAQARLGGARSN